MPGARGSAHPEQMHDCAALQGTFDWRCFHLRMNFSEYAQHQEAWYSWALGLKQHGVDVLSLTTEDLLIPVREARAHAAPTPRPNLNQPASSVGRSGTSRSDSGGVSVSEGSGVRSGGRGSRRRLLNLTLLRRVTDFLEVAPSMRPRDVSLAKMELPGWFNQSATGPHPISFLV